MNEPAISVVLPTYNRLRRLKTCLPTFLETAADDAEFIIVDNRSTDGTLEYLTAVAKYDKRCRILQNPQNVGPIKTIFRAYCEVQSPYAIFIADDDKMSGDYISECKTIFHDNPRVALVHHQIDGGPTSEPTNRKGYSIYPAGDDAITKIFMMAGRYPGMAWRMSSLRLRDFPLGHDTLYPQVKVALTLAKDYEIAIVTRSGILPADFGDTIASKKVTQNRPADYGIGERLSYARESTDDFIYHELCQQTARWAFSIFTQMKSENPKDSKLLNRALARTLHSSNPYFIIRMLQSGYWLDAVQAIILTCTSLRFIPNYVSFCLRRATRKQAPARRFQSTKSRGTDW